MCPAAQIAQQKHKGPPRPAILQRAAFLTSVCAVAGSVSNYPGKLQPWPHPLRRIPLGSQGGQGTEEQEGSPRKAISMYMTSAPSQVWPTLYEKWGPSEQYSFNTYFDILETTEVIRERKMGEDKVPVPAKLLF